MSVKSICFIAQFPPPIHGLSKAVDTLYNSELNQKYEFEKVDITDNNNFIKNLISISKSKADVFYFTISQSKGGNLRDLIVLKLLNRQKKKCLVHLHGGYYRTLVDSLGKWQKKTNYNEIGKIDAAIVLGESLKWIFEGMLPAEKIFTVPNCVDDQYLMSDVDFQNKLTNIGNKRVYHVLYLSNFIRTKGYGDVLEMARLEKERADREGERRFHFDFAGMFFEETEERFFKEYVLNNALEDYVTYHGVVSGKQKQDLLMKCDFFALLTRYPNEGQPISILESMGNGMVAITTNHAGIPDVVKDGLNGIVMSKDALDVRQCYQSILNLSVDELKTIACNNRAQIKNDYNQRTYIEKMDEIFESRSSIK